MGTATQHHCPRRGTPDDTAAPVRGDTEAPSPGDTKPPQCSVVMGTWKRVFGARSGSRPAVGAAQPGRAAPVAALP